MSKNESNKIDLGNPYLKNSIPNFNDLWTNHNPGIIQNNIENIQKKEINSNNIISFGEANVQHNNIINGKKEFNQNIFIINHNMSINIESKAKKQKNQYYNLKKSKINNNNVINNKNDMEKPKNINGSLDSNNIIPNQVQNSIMENKPNPFFVKVNQSFQILGKNSNNENQKEEKNKEINIKNDLNPKVKVIKRRPKINHERNFLMGNISYFN